MNIWFYRNLTRQRPKSLFDNEYLKIYKDMHDKYGTRVQLNTFFQTDYFYDDDHFDLTQMTDAYKGEWKSNSYWLKMAFHGLFQEQLDYMADAILEPIAEMPRCREGNSYA